MTTSEECKAKELLMENKTKLDERCKTARLKIDFDALGENLYKPINHMHKCKTNEDWKKHDA